MATVAVEESLLFPESLGAPEGERGPCPPASLLLIVGEPFTIDQKDLILERIVTELSSWDCELAKCDVDEQLGAFAQQQPKPKEGPNGEKIFRLESAQLRVTVLVNARVQTVKAHIHSFLATPSTYLHLLHSGLALQGSGSWILQDGTFSFANLTELFPQKPDSKAGSGATLDISVLNEGPEWKEETLKRLAGRLRVRLNPPKIRRGEEDGAIQFTDSLSVSLKAPSSLELLPATDIVGSISFQRPTMYVFPAGSGDSAFFGVNGFNLLVNGGFCRRSCFWQLVRHLIRIDAVLVSHVGPENVFGISSFFERKAAEKTSPDVGLVYLNIGDTKPASLPVSSGLLVSLADEGANILDHLRHIGMKVSACAGSVTNHVLQPFNLYFNVGRGSLDLYVLSPLEGKDLKDFVGNFSKNVNSSNARTGIPLSDEYSVCSLLVWKPACPKEKTIRILFPGNSPQSKIFDGIERLKGMALFQSAGADKAADKVPDKKLSDKKVPDRKAAPPAAEADHKKSSAVTSEHKSLGGDQRDAKKPTEQHRDAKHSTENRTPGKVEVESKGKTEHKEQRTVAPVKKIEGKQGTGRPETVTKKAEPKTDQKEAKSSAKHEPDVRKEGKHPAEPKDSSKKAPDVEQKDSKRVFAATRSTAPETKEQKSPAVKQDSTPNKVGSKVAEKAAKDAKNKKVVKETQDAKTPKKKETAPKDSPAAASAGKRQKRDATAGAANGQRAAEGLVPPASVERPKIPLVLDSEQISKPQQQAVDETEDVGSVPNVEANASKSQEPEKSTKLSEATDVSVAKDKEPTRVEAEAELVVSSPELPPQIEELNTIVEDQPELGSDGILAASLVLEEPGLASDSAVSEKEIGFQSVSQLEESASSVPDTEPAEKSGSLLNQAAPGELDETSAILVGHPATKEVNDVLDPALSPASGAVIESPDHSSKEVTEESDPALDRCAIEEALEKLQHLADQPILEEDVVKKPETHSTTEEVIKMPEDHSSKEVTEESDPALDRSAVEEALEKLQLLVDQPVLEEDVVKKTHSTTEEVIKMPEDHSSKEATEESGPALDRPAVEEALEKLQLLVEQPVLEEDAVKKSETHSATVEVAEASKPASDNSVPKEVIEKKTDALEDHLSAKEILETVDPALNHPTAEDGIKTPEPSVKHPDHEEAIEKSEGHFGDSVPQEDVIKKLEDSPAGKEEVVVPEPKLDDSVPQEVIEKPEPLVEHPAEKAVVETADPALGQDGSEGEVEKLEAHLGHHDSEDVIKKPEDHDATKEVVQLSDPDEEIINKAEPSEDHCMPKDVVEPLDKSSNYLVSEEGITRSEKPTEHPVPETDTDKGLEEHPATKEVVKVVEASGPALALPVSDEEVVEKPEPVLDQDHHGSGDKVTGEVVTRSLPYEDITEKPNQMPSLAHPDANESSEVPEIIKGTGTKSGDLIENLAASQVKEPFEIPDTVDDDDVLISPDEPSHGSLVEKDLFEKLEKEETVVDVGDALSGKQDSEIVEGQKEKSVEEKIPAKTLHAEGHSTSLEKNLPEVSEDPGVKETGKHLPDAGKQGKAEAKEEDADYPGAGDEKEELVPVKAGVEQLDASKEESFTEGDRSRNDVNLSATNEASFDPEKSWGQPEGLPAPMNRKKDGDGDRGNHASSTVSGKTASSTAAGKKPASQPNASGKKSDGTENSAGVRRSTAAAKAERSGDEGAKLPASRGAATGAQRKKPAPSHHSTDPSTRTPHPAVDGKKTASKAPVVPFYVDLAYVPSHGDTRSFDADFFRSVRAQYYVLSSSDPDPRVLGLLLDAKEDSWGNEEAATTVIPTYESARLTAWAAENRDRLSLARVVVAVSANRHTMQLQEQDAICQAYRLEF